MKASRLCLICFAGIMVLSYGAPLQAADWSKSDQMDSPPPVPAAPAPAAPVPTPALAPAPAAAMQHPEGGDHSPTERGLSDSHPPAPDHPAPPKPDAWVHPEKPSLGQQPQQAAPDESLADTTEAIPDANASNADTSDNNAPSPPSLTGHHYTMDDLTNSMQSVDSNDDHSSMDDLAESMGEL